MSPLVIPDDRIAVHKLLRDFIPDTQVGSERVDENQGNLSPRAIERVVDGDTVPSREVQINLPSMRTLPVGYLSQDR